MTSEKQTRTKICKWCASEDFIIAPAYPVKHRRLRCASCHRKENGCDCYDPTFCSSDCQTDKYPRLQKAMVKYG